MSGNPVELSWASCSPGGRCEPSKAASGKYALDVDDAGKVASFT